MLCFFTCNILEVAISGLHVHYHPLLLTQVLQTLLEAEQLCTELQHSVSGLDSRLAELRHWETEARDLYQLLRAAERQHRGQDPRTKVRRSSPE